MEILENSKTQVLNFLKKYENFKKFKNSGFEILKKIQT
jgi:hypothetical protein